VKKGKREKEKGLAERKGSEGEEFTYPLRP
jgi:hypothetical protein